MNKFTRLHQILSDGWNTFSGYAQHHREKGATEKEQRNSDMAKTMNEGLRLVHALQEENSLLGEEERDTRDFYAGCALIGLLMTPNSQADEKTFANASFNMADEMMKRRKE